MNKEPKGEFNTITIEATPQGWIVTEKSQQKKLFFLWRTLLSHIESRISTK